MSFLQPTRMTGRPLQKCWTSEIHWRQVESQDKDNGTAETNLLLNVVQRIWRINGKTNEDDVGVWVAEWAEAVVVFLTGGIPQRELDVFSINLNVCNVVLKDGRDINLVENGIVRPGSGGKRRYKPLGKFLSRRLSTGRSGRDEGMR